MILRFGRIWIQENLQIRIRIRDQIQIRNAHEKPIKFQSKIRICNWKCSLDVLKGNRCSVYSSLTAITDSRVNFEIGLLDVLKYYYDQSISELRSQSYERDESATHVSENESKKTAAHCISWWAQKERNFFSKNMLTVIFGKNFHTLRVNEFFYIILFILQVCIT